MSEDPPWAPQHAVGVDRAVALVKDQFPEFAAHPPIHLGAGWCNDVYAFGEVAFRFPRRAMGVAGLKVEGEVLPWLSALLPVAVPQPLYYGEPARGYPSPFLGYQMLTGESADHADPRGERRAGAAEVLGQLCRALHSFRAEDVGTRGVPDGARRTDLARRVELSWARLEDLEAAQAAASWAAVRAAMQAAPANFDGAPVLCHGDLYPRHVLVDDAGVVTGIIDWEDVCTGDSAADLSVVFTMLPEAERSAFWAEYGEVSEACLGRARAFAATYRVALAAQVLDQSGEAPEHTVGWDLGLP